MLVDNPILNSPFEEPAGYWAYEEGRPVVKEGRRPAGYCLHVVLDVPKWEHTVAYQLEQMPEVVAYASLGWWWTPWA